MFPAHFYNLEIAEKLLIQLYSNWKTLAEAAPLRDNQLFFSPRPDYRPQVFDVQYVPHSQGLPAYSNSVTPPPSPHSDIDEWMRESTVSIINYFDYIPDSC